MSKKSTKKKMSNRKYLGITSSVVALLLVVIIAANVAIHAFYDTIDLWFSGSGAAFESEDSQSAREYAKGVAADLQAEGIVLLKNESNTLPLSVDTTKKLAVFGWDSHGAVLGGTGSGAARTDKAVSLYTALENQGFELYEELKTLYKDYKSDRQAGLVVGSTDFTVHETPLSEYSDAILNGAKEFTDTALVVFGRTGGEGNDLPEGYLELSQDERDILDWVTGNFEHVIVLLNIANAMEIGFVKEYENIDAAMWIGYPGLEGMTSVAKVLAGEINPSGRLADTYVYDLTQDPTYHNSSTWGVKMYTDKANAYYVDYSEGIYVGYRYYETAAEEGYIDYDKTVVYPFGYGISYTTFEQSIKSFNVNDDVISVEVEVKNTGDFDGKEVVQVYFTPPYDPAEKIEKAHVELVGYAKTDVIKAGATDTVTVEFHVDDMAAYDYLGEKAYVLSAGDYAIKLMANSHDLIDSRTYTIDKEIVYNESGAGARYNDKIAATNLFDYADGADETIPVKYMTREDMTLPAATEPRAASEAVKAHKDDAYEKDPTLSDIVTEVDAGLMLEDMVGLDYDDPKWDTFMDQLSFKEMTTLVAYGGYKTKEIESIGKPETIDLDGPNGFNEANTSVDGEGGIAYPCEVVIASTWNDDLAEIWGESLGNESVNYGVSGWYAPGVNIHRSQFGGRNFEYFSEDPLLSGRISANTIYGASKFGLYCYVKHFAVNDLETMRNGLFTWVNEQAMREIYFTPFQYSVVEGGSTAVMSAFNRIGAQWAGSNKELLTNVLRDEWGFRGMVISDYYMSFQLYMDVYAGVVAGNDLFLSGIEMLAKQIVSNDVTVRNAVRQSAKNILYTVANSNTYGASFAKAEDDGAGWTVLIYILNGFLAACVIVMVVAMIRRTRKHKAYIISLIEARENGTAVEPENDAAATSEE